MEQVNQNLLFRTHLLPDSTRDKPLLFTSQTLFYLLFSLSSPQSPSSSSFLHPSSHFHLLPSRTEESTSTRNPVPSIHLPRLKRIFRKLQLLRFSSASSKIDAITQHLEGLGEDYIMQETLGLSKKLKEILRFRGMRITDEMKKRQNNSVEWFAHLTERLVAITP